MSFSKIILVPLLLGYCLLTAPVSVEAADEEVYIGTTPCEVRYRAELEVPVASPCEMIRWELTLFGKPKTTEGKFRLRMSYGLSKQNSNAVRDGGTSVLSDGTWKVQGAESSSLKLESSQPERIPITLKRIGEGLLHFLDRSDRLMVGHGGWSYTLNRSSASGEILPTPGTYTKPVEAPVSLAGRFVGRSPCHEMSEILGQPSRPDCIKIKWEFRFQPDPNDRLRGTFTLRHTFMRDVFALSGNFETSKQNGSMGSPVVYRLTFPTYKTGTIMLMRTSEETVVFLDHDRKPIIGNGDFGYTLNRSE